MGYVWKHIFRKPLAALAVLCFGAVIALTLCGLKKAQAEALVQYQEVFRNVKVDCRVTNLTGSQSDNLHIFPALYSQFLDSGTPLGALVENVQIKGTTDITWNGETYTLVGLNATQADRNLLPENGCTIFWNEGLGEWIFSGDEAVCLVSVELEKELKKAELEAFPLHLEAGIPQFQDYDGELVLAGTYQGSNNRCIYCPWDSYVAMAKTVGSGDEADSLSATLRDNNLLTQLREEASRYLAQPDPNAAGLDMVGEYYLALDINDYQLTQAKTNLENSMTVIRIGTALVLTLSAGAGAFVGFLIIRNRKREIILMRTMGTPAYGIFGSFALEQLACVVLGVVLGGAAFLWRPLEQLLLFVVIYALGLTLALLVFLRKNLMATIKEDE